MLRAAVTKLDVESGDAFALQVISDVPGQRRERIPSLTRAMLP